MSDDTSSHVRVSHLYDELLSFDWRVFLSLLEESSVINNGCRTVDDTAGWLGLWGQQLINAVMH